LDSSRYFDLDNCASASRPDDDGTDGDDDVQISRANLVAHGHAIGVVHADPGEGCPSVVSKRDFPAFGVGNSYCGISGNSKRFRLTIIKDEDDTVWLRIDYSS